MRLADASILVTGASSGIGAALARALGREGARLTLTARREDRLHGLAANILCRGGRLPHVVPGDIAEPGFPARLVDSAVAVWGGLDAVVNNAGISAYGDSAALPDDAARRILDVNFLAPVRVIQAALPGFRQRNRGLVVNVSSLAALHGVPYLGVYGASKAALSSYAQSLRAELHGTGVRVLSVYPGYTDTEIFARESCDGSARRPFGRYAPPEAVAAAIVRAMRREREELVLTLAGKAMHTARAIAPRLLDRVMEGLARRLATASSPGGAS